MENPIKMDEDCSNPHFRKCPVGCFFAKWHFGMPSALGKSQVHFGLRVWNNSLRCTWVSLKTEYPLVNIQKTMENHLFQWVNPLFLWSFSIGGYPKSRRWSCYPPFLGLGDENRWNFFSVGFHLVFLDNTHQSSFPKPNKSFWDESPCIKYLAEL